MRECACVYLCLACEIASMPFREEERKERKKNHRTEPKKGKAKGEEKKVFRGKLMRGRGGGESEGR